MSTVTAVSEPTVRYQQSDRASFGTQSSDGRSRALVSVAVVTSITLVRLPDLFGFGAIAKIAVVVLFLGAAAWALPRRALGLRWTFTALAVAGFVALTGASLVRGSIAGVYSSLGAAIVEATLYVALFALAVFYVASARNVRERNRSLVWIALAPAAYCALNLALYATGFRPPGTQVLSAHGSGTLEATLLGFVGVHITRVQFPLATSINLFGVIAAAAMVGAALLFIRGGTSLRKAYLAAGAGAGAICVLMGDSRGPLLAAIAVTAFFLLNRRGRGSSIFAALLPLLPLVVLVAVSALDSTGVSSVLSRGGSAGDFSTATGRAVIWGAAWDFLGNVRPEHLFGWGAYGQVTSGASLGWAFLFRGVLDDPTTASTHDLIIQTIFDTGYLGLVVLVASVVSSVVTLGRAARAGYGAALALSAMLLVVVLSGATEVSLSYLAQEALIEGLLIMGAAVALGALDPARMPARSRIAVYDDRTGRWITNRDAVL